MKQETLTRADLASSIYKEIGLSHQESLELVDSVLEEVSASLARKKPVKISGFGTFVLHNKNERIGRNPKTGREVPITPRCVISFRASYLLKKEINR